MRFNLFGTRIQISFLFVAVIILLLVTDKTGLALYTLAAAALHEMGHLLAMRLANCQPKAIRLVPAAIQIVRGFSQKKHGELIIALFGPSINLLFYLSFRLCYFITDQKWMLNFALINLLLGIFNLLPVAGLDGGSVLQIILEHFTDTDRALAIVRSIGFAFGILSLTGGIFLTAYGSFNLSIYIVAVYLLITAFIRL